MSEDGTPFCKGFFAVIFSLPCSTVALRCRALTSIALLPGCERALRELGELQSPFVV